MAKKVNKLLGEYSKYCPRCRTYQNRVYQQCVDCKTVLVDGWEAYKRHRVKQIIRLSLLISLLILATYGIQKDERKYYNQSIKFFISGRFRDSGTEFYKAFSVNPLYKFVSSGIEKIKYKITHRTVIYELR